jgi:hypothetical protein
MELSIMEKMELSIMEDTMELSILSIRTFLSVCSYWKAVNLGMTNAALELLDRLEKSTKQHAVARPLGLLT